jgi:hypothetical protein
MRVYHLVMVFTFLLVFFGGFASAENIIGVSPGTVYFKNVLRGGYAERYLSITTPNMNEDLMVSAKPRGDIASWIEFSENFTVSKNEPGRLFIAVRPPADIPNGNYTGFLRISTGAVGDVPSGQAVTAVRAVIDVAIVVEITDVEIQSCTARAFSVYSAEKGDDVIFEFNVYNQGNIRLNPLVTLEIWDQEQISIVKTLEFRAEDILPTKEQGVRYRLSTDDFDPDQYWVSVKVPDCFSESLLTFDVLELGALKSEGVLLRVYGIPWGQIGDTIPIVAEFKNTGEKDVNAKFKGQINLDGKIERVLESEEINVPISTMENFTFFFTPDEPGSYVVSGRVFYDKKRTFEASGVFNVRPKTFSFKNVVMVFTYLILMVVIAFLLYKVHRERKKYLGKVRGLRYA